MRYNDYLKCPGLDRTLAVVPETYPCPICHQPVEIWTDEKFGRCHCGAKIRNRRGPFSDAQNDPPAHRSPQEDSFKALLQSARKLGATDAKWIHSGRITLKDEFAKLCQGPNRCPNYGLACSCPPHVPGPQGFRKWQQNSTHAIVIRIDLPVEVMFSSGRREVGQVLHEIVATLEKEAIQMGYTRSKAFAGGSCKKIFCHEHNVCRVISKQGECRHPDFARPSMSGFGIDVTTMMQTAGWPVKEIITKKASENERMAWVAGLVLLA